MRTPLKGCGSCILFVFTTYIVYKLSLPVFLENIDPEGNIPSDNRFEPKWKRAYGGRHLICHHFHGGIGDQLFQYASLLAIAQPQQRILVTKGGDSMLENFLIDFKARPGASHCDKIEKIVEKFCCRDDDRFINLDASKNYDFEGSLRTWIYFKDKEEFIKKHLQFQKPAIEKAKSVIENVLKSKNASVNKNVLIGVHVRRGDRVKEPHLNDGYRVAPKEYFHAAMNNFRKRFSHPVFLVVSQDSLWCKENILGAPDVFFVPPQESEIDMAFFTLVHHSIVSVGTFSWWAGHFTKGEVIYYKQPIEPDSKMMTHYGGTLDKTFKPTWMAMGEISH